MQSSIDVGQKRAIILTGFAGLLAAILVGAGEFMLQFNSLGGYESPDYAYFGRVPIERLTTGHFLAVFSAPLYVAGYWHIFKMLEPAGKKLSCLVFLIGGYSFIIGTAWISQRIFLGLTVHEINTGADLSMLLAAFAERNEPFVNVLRVAMLAISVIWIFLIIFGKSHYPRWMAIFSPFAILASIFALYFAFPPVGLYVIPIAMNITHAIVFALSIMIARSRL